MPRRYPGYFDGRECCKCGNDKTYMKGPNSPIWFKDYDKRGIHKGDNI